MAGTELSFSTALTTELTEKSSALPAGFNIDRFVQNSVALLNGNESLMEFAKKYGTAQIKSGLVRAAMHNLDAMNKEVYLVPYGNVLNFTPSYIGMIKMAHQYSVEPVKDIYARVVRQGDEFEEAIIDGRPSVNFKPLPFNGNEIIGVFAVCSFTDGRIKIETMSRDEIEACRSRSKAKNAGAWEEFYQEMAKKTVIRRLCKGLTLNLSADGIELFNSGTEIETDPAEIARQDIEQNANKEEFVMDIGPDGTEEFS